MKQGNDGALKLVYEAADKFVEVALRTHDSLFTPGRPVWSDSTIADLHERFVMHPDESSASFEQKFQKQLEGAPADTYQLAAELLYVHLLPGSSTGGNRKRELINAVLGWSPKPVTIPSELAKALDNGLAAEGIAFRTCRPFLLIYLLEFIRHWRSLDDETRRRALEDPWAFKEVVFSVPMPNARSQAEILLHLVHPDSFEDIMSRKNKAQIADAFGDLINEPTDDVDRKLAQIRRRLTEQCGTKVSFWSPELISKWQPDASPWSLFVRFAQLFYQLPNFEENERDYKLRLADEARPIIEALDHEPDDENIERLQKLFRKREQNLVRWQDCEPFVKWYRGSQPLSHMAVTQLRDTSQPAAERMRGFLHHLPIEVVKSLGNRTTLASFFLFSLDPLKCPPYRATVFDWAVQRTGYPVSAEKADEGARYESAIGFLDQMIQECANRGLKLRDRLDAQGILWSMAKSKAKPEAMGDADWQAFLQFRGGQPSLADDDGEGPAAVQTPPAAPQSGSRVWAIALGEGGRLWNECQELGMIAIGWDFLEDLSRYRDQEEITKAIAKHRESDAQPTNQSLCCWEFTHEIGVGDTVIAKIGRQRLLGVGIVKSGYEYKPERAEYKNTRQVEWLKAETIDVPEGALLPIKTLTEVTNYRAFMEFVRENYLGVVEPPIEELTPYGVDDAMKGLFIPREDFERMLEALRTRKNVLLQGPPGVGKTFVARRLAWAFLKTKDTSRVQMIQFHQSYAYEDFIQGWRPNSKGGFQLKNGVFFEFCNRARVDKARPYVFIIDEINRGNLSKIFGELMMLIEHDKRGSEHAVSLTYSEKGEQFSVPENVHLLGLMNTADRSLAMVDYALRRRFRFFTLRPRVDRPEFAAHLRARRATEHMIQKITDRLSALNKKILEDHKNLGEGFTIGHSFFCAGDNVTADELWYRNVIEGEVAPLLEEYWFDRRERAKQYISELLAP